MRCERKTKFIYTGVNNNNMIIVKITLNEKMLQWFLLNNIWCRGSRLNYLMVKYFCKMNFNFFWHERMFDGGDWKCIKIILKTLQIDRLIFENFTVLNFSLSVPQHPRPHILFIFIKITLWLLWCVLNNCVST